MKILLVLMVKNESRILLRCLENAAPFADAVLVADTGSTDETLLLARSYNGRPTQIVQDSWANFGVNRTKSLEAARAYAVKLGWCLDQTYALVIDADMRLQGSPEELRKRLESRPKGAQLLQKCGHLEYLNTRFLLLSDPWYCEGVTHEYWTGEQGEVVCIDRDAAWIDDIGDGGSKADKFERDEKLLLAGLDEKPNCERYMFYLAQTYHCLNRHAEAIHWYKKRIEAGGWIQEIWYSLYMIVANLLRLGNIIEAEGVAQQAFVLQPDRIEALVLIVRHLRETQPFKAWHYVLLAEKAKPEGSKLFLETDAHERLKEERRLLEARTSVSFFAE